MGANTMERKIVLLPVGKVEGWVQDVLADALARTYEELKRG
jgi:hypothetical protein